MTDHLASRAPQKRKEQGSVMPHLLSKLFGFELKIKRLGCSAFPFLLLPLDLIRAILSLVILI
jgi:hypothetical protein